MIGTDDGTVDFNAKLTRWSGEGGHPNGQGGAGARRQGDCLGPNGFNPICRSIDNHIVTRPSRVIPPGRKVGVNGVGTWAHRISAFVPNAGRIVEVLGRKAGIPAGKIPVHSILAAGRTRSHGVGHGRIHLHPGTSARRATQPNTWGPCVTGASRHVYLDTVPWTGAGVGGRNCQCALSMSPFAPTSNEKGEKHTTQDFFHLPKLQPFMP